MTKNIENNEHLMQDNKRCHRCMEYMFGDMRKGGISSEKLKIIQYLDIINNDSVTKKILKYLENMVV